MTEAAFQNQVVSLARMYGWLIMHTRPAQLQSGRWSTPIQGYAGFPDLVLAHPTGVIFAELKSATGRLRPEQERWIETLISAGSEVYVWRPDDLPLIAKRLALKAVSA